MEPDSEVVKALVVLLRNAHERRRVSYKELEESRIDLTVFNEELSISFSLASMREVERALAILRSEQSSPARRGAD